MAESILEISDLNAYYGKSHILQGVNMAVGQGELVVVVGRNGMGKTTLMRAILGYPPVQRTGRIVLAGKEISRLSSYEIARLGVGYVPQGRLLFPSLSVEEHLRLAASPKGKDKKSWRLEAIYELFPELKQRAKVSGTRLSGGEQQMLAVARALIAGPVLLLMDEPSEGLSQAVIERVEGVCQRLTSEGISILLVEQNMDMAQRLADRAYVFLNGRIALEESGPDFRANRERVGAYLGV